MIWNYYYELKDISVNYLTLLVKIARGLVGLDGSWVCYESIDIKNLSVNRECLVNSKGRSSAACSHQGYRNFKTNFKQKMEAHQQWQKSVQKYDCINPKSYNCNDWKGWCTGPQGWLCQCRGRCLIGTWLTYVIVCI